MAKKFQVNSPFCNIAGMCRLFQFKQYIHPSLKYLTISVSSGHMRGSTGSGTTVLQCFTVLFCFGSFSWTYLLFCHSHTQKLPSCKNVSLFFEIKFYFFVLMSRASKNLKVFSLAIDGTGMK